MTILIRNISFKPFKGQIVDISIWRAAQESIFHNHVFRSCRSQDTQQSINLTSAGVPLIGASCLTYWALAGLLTGIVCVVTYVMIKPFFLFLSNSMNTKATIFCSYIDLYGCWPLDIVAKNLNTMIQYLQLCGCFLWQSLRQPYPVPCIFVVWNDLCKHSQWYGCYGIVAT